VDGHEDPDAHQKRRHTNGPLGVRVSLTIGATPDYRGYSREYWIPGTERKWPFTNE
jgi:hypothetical protein